MKYIRSQDGAVHSVSQLIPPMRGQKKLGDDPSADIWRLDMITMNGKRETYAEFRDMRIALDQYAIVVSFIGSLNTMIEFELGEGGECPPVTWTCTSSPRSDTIDPEKTYTTGEDGDHVLD